MRDMITSAFNDRLSDTLMSVAPRIDGHVMCRRGDRRLSANDSGGGRVITID